MMTGGAGGAGSFPPLLQAIAVVKTKTMEVKFLFPIKTVLAGTVVPVGITVMLKNSIQIKHRALLLRAYCLDCVLKKKLCSSLVLIRSL
jgi:hypothetical protein